MCILISFLYPAPSQTLNSPASLSPSQNLKPHTKIQSLPVVSATPLHDEEPLLVFDDSCVSKPRTQPRPARRSMPTKMSRAIAHKEVKESESREKVSAAGAKSAPLSQPRSI